MFDPTGPLSLKNVDAQFCSDWLKDLLAEKNVADAKLDCAREILADAREFICFSELKDPELLEQVERFLANQPMPEETEPKHTGGCGRFNDVYYCSSDCPIKNGFPLEKRPQETACGHNITSVRGVGSPNDSGYRNEVYCKGCGKTPEQWEQPTPVKTKPCPT